MVIEITFTFIFLQINLYLKLADVASVYLEKRQTVLDVIRHSSHLIK